ncbi:hypothetical protein [Pseudoalteromonas sp. ASV78]|uniref:hypothetical protein n=1 Tax=Pseudoalteromonas sp. ASV78 TaxID=3397851 RepID=UPI0039FDA9C0
MIGTLKVLLPTMAKTLLRVFMSKKMVIWTLRAYAKFTKSKVDDHSVDLVEALLSNDVEAAREAVKQLHHEWITKDEQKAE